MKKYFAAGIALLFVLACGTGNEPSESDVNRLNDHANPPSSSVSSSPTKKAATSIKSGDWEVGDKDNLEAGIISPGTYIVTATETGFGCYWETVRNFDKEGNYIIANGNIEPGSTNRVVVKRPYVGLSLDGDCTAKKQVKR